MGEKVTWAIPKVDTYFALELARDPRGFQIDHLELALKQCSRRRLAVDGGAHIGTWTCALADQFLEVMAFEPAADTYACLVENTGGKANVLQFRHALGAEKGRATVVDDPTRQGNTGSRYLRPGGDVTVVPLDDYGLHNLDFLKLDVEGSELAALRGATETIQRCRPVVMIEVKKLRRGHDPLAAVQYLVGLGYREVARAKNDRVYVGG